MKSDGKSESSGADNKGDDKSLPPTKNAENPAPVKVS